MTSSQKSKRIVIATGIYPPRIGGPSFYAQSLEGALRAKGHSVLVVTYGFERHLPTGVRHLIYFFKLLFRSRQAEVIITLDTFSVGLPAACVRFFKEIPLIIRTGGDFLWEAFIERTGEKILLSNFYTKRRQHSLKEKLIFRLTKWVLHMADRVVFSTIYQRDIWHEPYNIARNKTRLIENYYGPKSHFHDLSKKVFVGYTRELKWKNVDVLERAFARVKKEYPDFELKTGSVPREQFLEDLEHCYAAVLVSLGDISPNMVLEALQLGKPVVLTKENGLTNRLGDMVIYVDPLDKKDIEEKLLLLMQPAQYTKYKERAEKFDHVHTYEEIADEFLEITRDIV